MEPNWFEALHGAMVQMKEILFCTKLISFHTFQTQLKEFICWENKMIEWQDRPFGEQKFYFYQYFCV